MGVCVYARIIRMNVFGSIYVFVAMTTTCHQIFQATKYSYKSFYTHIVTKMKLLLLRKLQIHVLIVPNISFAIQQYFPQAMILQFMGHIFQLYMCVCVVLGLSASFRYTVVPNLLMVLHQLGRQYQYLPEFLF